MEVFSSGPVETPTGLKIRLRYAGAMWETILREGSRELNKVTSRAGTLVYNATCIEVIRRDGYPRCRIVTSTS